MWSSSIAASSLAENALSEAINNVLNSGDVSGPQILCILYVKFL